MDKKDALTKLVELKRLQRQLETIAKQLNIGDISEDKIYIAIKVYKSTLINILEIKEIDG